MPHDAIPDQESAEEILARAGFFRRLTDAERTAVARIAEFKELASGHDIYKVGDAARYFYVLVEGSVRFSLPLGPRQATAGEVLRRGEVFGWAALVEKAERRIATASCITSCTLLAIDGPRLVALMEADHSLGYKIMRQLSVLITSTLTAYAAG